MIFHASLTIGQFCMVRVPYFILIYVFLCQVSLAQDSLSTSPPPKPTVKPISSVLIQLDNRREDYINTRGRMNGIKLGLESYRRIQLGVGFYANNGYYSVPYPESAVTMRHSARLNYTTFFTEFIFFRNFRWQLSVGGAIGRGRLLVNIYELNNGSYEFLRQDRLTNVGIADIGVHTMFRVFPWLGVGAGYGRRQVYDSGDDLLDTYFSDPYFDFKIKFSLGYFYKDIFKGEEIAKERKYYAWRKQKRWAYVKDLFN